MPEPYEAITEDNALDILRRWIPAKRMPDKLLNREWYCAVSDEDSVMEALEAIGAIEGALFNSYNGERMVSLIGVPCEPEIIYTQMSMF